MINSIADNLKKYNKYCELQKTNPQNNYIYNYKVAHYRELLQNGGVQLDRLDKTPLQTITNTIHQIDGILNNRLMRGGGPFNEELERLQVIVDGFPNISRHHNGLVEKKNAIIAQINTLLGQLKDARESCAMGNTTVAAANAKAEQLLIELEQCRMNWDETTQELRTVESKVAGMKATLDDATINIERQTAELNDKRTTIDDLQAKMEALNIDIATDKQRFNALVNELNGKIKETQGIMNSQDTLFQEILTTLPSSQ